MSVARRLATGTCMPALTLCLLLFSSVASRAESDGGSEQERQAFRPWESVEDLQAAGWSSDGLAAAEKFATSFDELAVMVVESGRVVAAWGDVARPTIIQSVRKSFMNALYGIAAESGKIDLDATLEQLEIDEASHPLTELERGATVRHLLESRSGVYLDAATTPTQQREARPERGSHKPGEAWFYNNWGFNVLGTIYQKKTGEDVFEAFEQHVARPIGMEDFKTSACEARKEDVSMHVAHHFSVSARDLARFGQLYLQSGKWEGKQILTDSWVSQSTTAVSGDDREGYGLLWWVQHRIRGFAARGGDSQLVLVVPERELVIVTQIPRHAEKRPGWNGVGRLLGMILQAKR